jgi:hypothetical protein
MDRWVDEFLTGGSLFRVQKANSIVVKEVHFREGFSSVWLTSFDLAPLALYEAGGGLASTPIEPNATQRCRRGSRNETCNDRKFLIKYCSSKMSRNALDKNGNNECLAKINVPVNFLLWNYCVL